MAIAKHDLRTTADGGRPSEPGGDPFRDGDAPPRAVASVSESLRQGRIKAGLSVAEVADLLCIRQVYLQAIEEGRFAELPGKVYAIGFVRSYADFLNLDGERLVQRFKSEVSGLNSATELVFPVPAPESRTPSGAIMLVALLMAGMAYGGWYYVSSQDRDLASLVPELPQRFSTMLDEESTSRPLVETGGRDFRPAAAGATEILQDAVPDADRQEGHADRSAPPAADVSQVAALPPDQAQPTPMPDGDADDGAAAPASGTDGDVDADRTVAPEGPPPPPPLADVGQPRRYGSPDGNARIVIRATGLSYIEVLDGRSQRLWWKTLRPGESYGVPDVGGLRMVTGNAGGLQIEVDGRIAPAVGGHGEVVRNISLEASRLLDGTAVN